MNYIYENYIQFTEPFLSCLRNAAEANISKKVNRNVSIVNRNALCIKAGASIVNRNSIIVNRNALCINAGASIVNR